MENLDLPSLGAAVGLSLFLSVRGYRKRSLSKSGALAALLVGVVVSCCGSLSTSLLIVFYTTGSYLTRVGRHTKAAVEHDYQPTGYRGAVQVFCNGGVAAALCAHSLFLSHGGGFVSRAHVAAVTAQLAALQGDTWSSELGVLSHQTPRLIFGFRSVPRGTNGAVTLAGIAAAAASGVLSGAVAASCATFFPLCCSNLLPTTLFWIALTASVAGSVLDSFFGQLLQRSVQMPGGQIADCKTHPSAALAGGRVLCGVPLLSNNGVNFLTSVVVAVFAFSAFA